MESIGYYPGCSLAGTAREYDQSLRAVAGHMGLELKEVPDWVCCGATSAHAVDHHAALVLAADTLAKARKAGLDEMLVPCAMCYQRLASAVHQMTEQPKLLQRLAAALGEKPDAGMQRVKVRSLIDWVAALPEHRLKTLVSRPLTGVKVVCYYGCLLVRPTKITGVKDVEAPRSMERVLERLGAQPLRWSMATECCGASFSLSRTAVVLRQGRRIYEAARRAGADAICLACPMCQSNLDMRQREFVAGEEKTIPVLYLTQLMGMAFGVPAESLGLRSHFVPVELKVT